MIQHRQAHSLPLSFPPSVSPSLLDPFAEGCHISDLNSVRRDKSLPQSHSRSLLPAFWPLLGHMHIPEPVIIMAREMFGCGREPHGYYLESPSRADP